MNENTAPDSVDVWVIHLDRDPAFGSFDILAADEQARARALRRPIDRDRYVAAHVALRVLLSRYIHEAPDRILFSSGIQGKPLLRSVNAVEFNLSHSNNLALVAVSASRPVGVDIEFIREDAAGDIAAMMLSEAERNQFQMAPAERQTCRAFQYWTRKEAYAKASGIGLHKGLQSLTCSLEPVQIVNGIQIEGLEIDSSYAAAVAAAGSGWRVTVRMFGS